MSQNHCGHQPNYKDTEDLEQQQAALSRAAGAFGCEQPCVVLRFKEGDKKKTRVGICGNSKL